MNPATLIVGAGASLFGFYTLYLRFSDPSKLGKLKPMQDHFGAGLGSAIHVIAYTGVPIGFGAFVIFLGLQGRSLF